MDIKKNLNFVKDVPIDVNLIINIIIVSERGGDRERLHHFCIIPQIFRNQTIWKLCQGMGGEGEEALINT